MMNLTKEYMTQHLESIKEYGVDANYIIQCLQDEILDFDKRITKMAQENDTNNPLYNELQELRETSLQSIESWSTML